MQKRLRLVRHYSWLSAVAAGLVVTACILQVVFLAVWKSDWMDICEDRNEDNWDEDDDGPLEDWCDSVRSVLLSFQSAWHNPESLTRATIISATTESSGPMS